MKRSSVPPAPDTIPETWAIRRESRAPTQLDMTPIPLTLPSRADRRRRAWLIGAALVLAWALGVLTAALARWAAVFFDVG